MTGVRALVRRGLTSKIHCEPIRSGLEGKFLLDLVLQMRGDGLPREHFEYQAYLLQPPLGTDPPRGREALSVSTTATSDVCPVAERKLTIALVSAQLNGLEDTGSRRAAGHWLDAGDVTYIDFDMKTDIPFRLDVYNTINMWPDQGFVTNTLKGVKDYMRLSDLDDREAFDAARLCDTIEEMAKFLYTTKSVIWKRKLSVKNLNSDVQVDGFSWGFDINTGALDSTGDRFQVTLSVFPEPSRNRWVLDDASRKTINGLVKWSAQTLRDQIMDSTTTAVTGWFLGVYVLAHGDVDCHLFRWIGHASNMRTSTHGALRFLDDDTPQRWNPPPPFLGCLCQAYQRYSMSTLELCMVYR